jgi:hypothetical protein
LAVTGHCVPVNESLWLSAQSADARELHDVSALEASPESNDRADRPIVD